MREVGLGDGDGLQQRVAAGDQPITQGREVDRPVGLAHRLDHLDGDNAVELALDIAIVLQPQVDAIRDAPAGRALAREGELLGRQRHADDRHAASRHLGRQRAPAAADLQHALARPQVQQRQDAIESARLGFLQRQRLPAMTVRRIERAGVQHAVVQPAAVEVVAQVVMRGDVVPAAAPGVGIGAMQQPGQPARRTARVRQRAQRCFIGDAEGQQRGQRERQLAVADAGQQRTQGRMARGRGRAAQPGGRKGLRGRRRGGGGHGGGEDAGARRREVSSCMAVSSGRVATADDGDRCMRGVGPRLQPRALDPQAQGFPVDADDHLERQQRIGDQQREQGAVAQGRARRVKARVQDGERLPRPLDAEAVMQVHAEKGRDVEPLVAALRDGTLIALGVVDGDQVAVALAEGVVDLVDDRLQAAVGRVAEPHAQGIEGVAEQARQRQQPDRAAAAQAGLVQTGLDLKRLKRPTENQRRRASSVASSSMSMSIENTR
ncbi:hypothetical protein Ddc_23783 [Ditylenchus destructor]|nr:hypothetical protein Ddc_23783 [Ditylenchus destructor]